MKFTNDYGLPDALLAAFQNDPYDGSDNPKAISVNQLIDSPKIRLLSRLHKEELEQDISECMWMLLGSAIHGVLERAKSPDRIIEERMELPVGDFILRGKPDLFDKKTGELSDWKVTSAWSVVKGSRKPEWGKQLNCYALMFRAKGYKVTSLTNNLLLRDWSRTEAKRSPDYPPIPFTTVKQDLSPDYSEEINKMVKLHKDAEKIDVQELTCTPDEMWTRPTTYAVYKNEKDFADGKRASRVLDSMKSAEEYVGTQKLVIRERVGVDARCQDYCPVRKFCKKALSQKTGE